MLQLSTVDSLSFLNFGRPDGGRKTFNSIVLKSGAGKFHTLFRPFVWNHFCVTYEKAGWMRVALVWRSNTYVDMRILESSPSAVRTETLFIGSKKIPASLC